MKGTRVSPTTLGLLPPTAISQPGAYGQATNEFLSSKHGNRLGYWSVTAPDGSSGLIPPSYEVTEHPDGTITVTEEIDFSATPWNGWRGRLVAGEWIATDPTSD